MKKTSFFKQLMLDKKILVLPGCHDALSAKIVEMAGFKAVTVGGYSATAATLGKPDVSILTLTESVNLARNIVQSVDLPLFVDGDTGHGNVTNVQRTIREFESAGVAGLFIEDQVFPKRCGHMEGKQVVSALEMVAKVKAAVDARIDEDFVIMARTDAIAIHGVNAAIERANLYREAGADLIFVEAPTSVEQMKLINESINAPTLAIQIEGGKTPLMTIEELEKLGFNIVAYPLSSIYTVAWAMKNLYEHLMRDGNTRNVMDRMICFDDFNTLIGLDRIRDIESHYYREMIESLKE